MRNYLVVLVGVQGSGKSTLLNVLKSNSSFKVLTPSTTRPKRDNDDSEYYFESELSACDLCWVIEYRSFKYGLKKTELESLNDVIGLTVFEPSQIHVLKEYKQSNPSVTVITVGLNNLTSFTLQNERVSSEERKLSEKDFNEAHDKVKKCDVVISGESQQTADAVNCIAKYINSRSGVVSQDILSGLMRANSVITNYTPKNLKLASYDLNLGSDIWCQGHFISLSDNKPFLEIPAYSYAIVSAEELANLPSFFSARFGLKNSLFFQGVILSNGPQIDPGYKGSLFCMLYNGRDSSVKLKKGDAFATIEFLTVTSISDGYKGKYQNKTKLVDFMNSTSALTQGGQILERTQSAIKELAGEFKEFKSESISSQSDFRNLSFVLLGIIVTAFLAMAIYEFGAIKDLQKELIKVKEIRMELSSTLENKKNHTNQTHNKNAVKNPSDNIKKPN